MTYNIFGKTWNPHVAWGVALTQCRNKVLERKKARDMCVAAIACSLKKRKNLQNMFFFVCNI